ncbi:MAG TPA: class I SAM-dependent methyltransferase [Patescibacteria group bacterium]|nr:class I SAM-dependent methyltransferase [Patescibacteria group bacterium]
MSVYNAFAEEFAQTRDYRPSFWNVFLSYVPVNARVLDIGCGNGRLYQVLAQKQVTYVGLDNSQELLKIAAKENPAAQFLNGDMRELPFSNEEFDTIFCLAAFHHLDNNQDRIKVLQGIRRILRPAGHLIMTNWNLGSQWAKAQVEKGKYRSWGFHDFVVPWQDTQGNVLGERYYHGFDFPELEKLFRAAGWRQAISNEYLDRQGEKSNQENGDNLLSIWQKD